jgi:hypothetical protein
MLIKEISAQIREIGAPPYFGRLAVRAMIGRLRLTESAM